MITKQINIIVKNTLHAINILNIILIACFIGFFLKKTIISYKKAIEISHKIEVEYTNAIENYKKLLIFILRNDLPTNIAFINAAAISAYNVSAIKNYTVYGQKKFNSKNNKALNNSELREIAGCYNSRCLKIAVEKQKILDHITNKFIEHNEILIPISKSTTLKASINSFFMMYNYWIYVLLYLFIFYFFQYLFLVRINVKLRRDNFSIKEKLSKNQEELSKSFLDNNRLFNGALIKQELVDIYFTHYVHKLITREICVEQVALSSVVQQIESFCCNQLIKQGLKFELSKPCSNSDLKTDKEILFIVLLNQFYKAIFRAKTASEITANCLLSKNNIVINIIYNGYEYNSSLGNKIQICEVPAPILDELVKKIDIQIKESRKNETNIISIKMAKEMNVNETGCKIIKFKLIK